ncbi:hypothetical protein Bca4012_085298 [Brassica carinata]
MPLISTLPFTTTPARSDLALNPDGSTSNPAAFQQHIQIQIRSYTGFTEKKSNTVAIPARQPSRQNTSEFQVLVFIFQSSLIMSSCDSQGPEFEAKIAMLDSWVSSREAVVQALGLFKDNEENKQIV